MRGLVTAIRTLTILPIPGRESDRFSSSLVWFPLVGLMLGGILFGLGSIWTGICVTDWSSGGAVLLLAAAVILTRGFHLDGLADWADAMGASRNPIDRLSIMKDPHLGTFGVLALILVLGIKWAAISRLLSFGSLLWLVPICAVPKGMMVELITTLPYARSEQGTARPFVDGATPQQRFLTHGLSLLVCLFFGPGGVGLLVLGGIVTGILKMSFKKSFGGITGDLLGTANEIVETILLVACALPGEGMILLMRWNW